MRQCRDGQDIRTGRCFTKAGDLALRKAVLFRGTGYVVQGALTRQVSSLRDSALSRGDVSDQHGSAQSVQWAAETVAGWTSGAIARPSMFCRQCTAAAGLLPFLRWSG